jgi:hypothetical protein
LSSLLIQVAWCGQDELDWGTIAARFWDFFLRFKVSVLLQSLYSIHIQTLCKSLHVATIGRGPEKKIIHQGPGLDKSDTG